MILNEKRNLDSNWKEAWCFLARPKPTQQVAHAVDPLQVDIVAQQKDPGNVHFSRSLFSRV